MISILIGLIAYYAFKYLHPEWPDYILTILAFQAVILCTSVAAEVNTDRIKERFHIE